MKAISFLFSILISMVSLANENPRHNIAYEVVKASAQSTAPGITNTTAYFIFKNHSGSTVRLIGAKSNVAQRVELHQHSMSDGLMKMQKVPKIEVAAGAEVIFEPGGYHLMLIDLNNTIKDGDSIELTLLFDNGGEVTVTIIAHKNDYKHKHHKH